MNRLTILVGIPGCGKSTYARTHYSWQWTVSSDKIRAELGDVNDQSKNGEVFRLFHAEVGALLRAGHDVVADSTALDAFARENLRKIAREVGSEIHLVYFSNVGAAVRRNQDRERVVPAKAMDRMLAKYEVFKLDLPRESVEYDTITEIRSFG
jgi:predicted kinase